MKENIVTTIKKMTLLLELSHPVGVDRKLANSRRYTWYKPVSERLALHLPHVKSGAPRRAMLRHRHVEFAERVRSTFERVTRCTVCGFSFSQVIALALAAVDADPHRFA